MNARMGVVSRLRAPNTPLGYNVNGRVYSDGSSECMSQSPISIAGGGSLDAGAPSVLIICPHMPPRACGIADYLAATLVEAARLGIRITVAHSEPDATPVNGVNLRHLPAVGGRAFVHAVRALIDELRPDVLHVQYQPGMYDYRVTICLLPRQLRSYGFRKPIVTTFHDFNVPFVFPKAKLIRPWFLRRLVKDSDWCVITNSLDRRTGVNQFGLREDRVVSIPIGSNFSRPGGLDEHHDGFRAGYFGLVTRDKGLEAAISATAAAAQAGVDIEFRVIGAWAKPDYVDELRGIAEAHGIADRVSFTGKIPGEDAARELSLLDTCLLLYDEGVSTRRTSFPSAMACGVPTITTAADLLPDGLEPGRNCFCVPLPLKAEDVAPLLIRLAREPELRHSVGAAARLWAEPLAYSHIGAQHADMYRRLARGEAPAGVAR